VYTKKQTPFGLISKAVFNELRKAGWSPGRDEEHIVKDYCQRPGSQWVPAAGLFIRSFGGLSFYGKLWPWKKPLWDQDLIDLKKRIAKAVGSKVVPVASSGYMSEGCVVWVDEGGRYYATNREEMIFIGSINPIIK